MENLYKILQLDENASLEVIKASYRALIKMRESHPDLGGDVKKAQMLNEAYEVLSNQEKKSQYDQQLRAHKASSEKPQMVLVVICLYCSSLNELPYLGSVFRSSCGKCGRAFTVSPKPQKTAAQSVTPQQNNHKETKNTLSPLRLAVFLYERRLYLRSIEQLNEILSARAKSIEANHLLGMCFYRLSRYQDANNQFSKVIQINPNHFLSLLYLAKSLMRLKEYAQAAVYFKSAAKIQELGVQNLLLMANCLFMNGDYDNAAEAFEQIVTLEPNNSNALFLLGMAYFKGSKFSKAFEIFRQGRTIYPENKKFDKMVKTTVDNMT